MIKNRIKNSFFCYLLVVSSVFSLLFLIPNYKFFPIYSFKDFVLVFFHWFISALGLSAVIIAMSLNRVVFSVIFPLFTFTTAVTAYFVWRIDLGVSAALIESVLLTSGEEMGSYISTSLIFWIIFSAILLTLSMFWRYRIKMKRIDFIYSTILFAVFISIFIVMNKSRNNSFLLRSPFSYYASYKELKKLALNDIQRTLLSDETIVFEADSDSLITVFVIGESLRSDYVQMGGYHRSTMPKMEARGVVYLPNIFSPFTYTAPSISYMLTRADSLQMEEMHSGGSFINLFKEAGYKTSWLGNQNPLPTHRFFVDETDTQYINKPYNTDYSNDNKYDSDLIKPFESMLSDDIEKQLFILHLAGNHWWYNKNLPEEFVVFTPILRNRELSIDNRERMVNSYDNVTRFVDYVLDEIISKIDDKISFVIFLSDHGESFGEEGKWLHANDTDFEKNPACFIWFSEKYKNQYSNKVESILLNSSKAVDTSFLFHTILDGSNHKCPLRSC